jgi:hypothetical protein
MFSNQNSNFGYNMEGLGMEKCYTIYDHLGYIFAIWYIYVMAI